jgi:nucleoside-diphosphate-sugar epimerase
MLQDNIKMMMHVFQAVSECPPAYLLYISSDAVFGDEYLPLQEKTIRAPSSLHGVMHLSRELVLESLSNVSVGVLRPTLIYGFGDPHNGYGPNRFIRLAKSGNELRPICWTDFLFN